MKNITKKQWIIGLIAFTLISFAVLVFVLRGYLAVHFPNEERVRTVKLTEYQRNSQLYLRISKSEKDSVQVNLYDKHGNEIVPKNTFYSTMKQVWSDGPGEGKYFYYGEVDKDSVQIRVKNLSNRIIWSPFQIWFLHGDRWTSLGNTPLLW